MEKEMATHSSNSCLENSMDREAWWAKVHEFRKNHEHAQAHIPLKEK